LLPDFFLSAAREREEHGNMASNTLTAAKAAKKDEFYTQLEDIAAEMKHYRGHFRGKTVLCNCDDPRVSNFFHYFAYQFEALGLKRLIATCYKNQDMDLFSRHDCERAIYLVYDGDKNGNRIPDPEEIGIRELHGDGDFRSPECVELLKQADIVVTNPPFSLFREYVAQLMEYGKKFLILGSQNNVTYKEIFPLILQNRLWTGYKAGDMAFRVPADSEPKGTRYWQDGDGQKWRSLGNICWFTNLDIPKRHEELLLFRTFSPEIYPHYDNYDAIEVGKVEDIPFDYAGTMGVPLTFLDKYNPDQFEILGITKTWFGMATKTYPEQIQVGKDGSEKRVSKLNDGAVLKVAETPTGKTFYRVEWQNYIQTYPRILIRRRKQA
jgi:hypothetical protein